CRRPGSTGSRACSSWWPSASTPRPGRGPTGWPRFPRNRAPPNGPRFNGPRFNGKAFMPKEEKAMRALVYPAPGAAEVRDLARPEPGPGEVLVRSRVVGVCHSDLELLAGRYIIPVSYPVVPGHEWSGEVAATGPGVTGFEAGDPVVGECVVGPGGR